LAKSGNLEEDFERFSRDIEQAAEEEIDTIRRQINALKEQANKTGEALSSPFSNEEKRS
jgi:hypothetical protein